MRTSEKRNVVVNEANAIDKSDLPLKERLWLWFNPSMKNTMLSKKLEEGRFTSADEYYEAKRKTSDAGLE